MKTAKLSSAEQSAVRDLRQGRIVTHLNGNAFSFTVTGQSGTVYCACRTSPTFCRKEFRSPAAAIRFLR